MKKEMNVLLVDDDEVVEIIFQRSFMKHRIPFPLYVAKNGREGLQMLRTKNEKLFIPRPVIIFLDLRMPQMNGIEFLREIRQDTRLKHLVVFVLTTSPEEVDRRAVYDFAAAGYIIKDQLSSDYQEIVTLLKAYWEAVVLLNNGAHLDV